MSSPISRFNNSRTRSSLRDIINSYSGQFGGHFLSGKAFDHVARLHIVKAFNADAAFHAGAHFVDFILKTAKGLHNSLVDQSFAPEDAGLAPDDAPGGDHAP